MGRSGGQGPRQREEGPCPHHTQPSTTCRDGTSPLQQPCALCGVSSSRSAPGWVPCSVRCPAVLQYYLMTAHPARRSGQITSPAPSDLGLGVLLTAQSSQQTRLFQLHVSTAAGDQYNTSGGSKQLLPFRLLYPSLIPRPCHKVARSPSTVTP